MTGAASDILGHAGAALLGFLLGFLVWGWGRAARLEAARVEGALSARTSLAGDPALHRQLEASAAERARLEAEVDRLTARIATLESAAASAGGPGRAAPAVQRPPGETRRRQGTAGPGEAPVVDEQLAPEATAHFAEYETIPWPPESTQRQQRSAPPDEPPVVDQQVPPAGERGAPRDGRG